MGAENLVHERTAARQTGIPVARLAAMAAAGELVTARTSRGMWFSPAQIAELAESAAPATKPADEPLMDSHDALLTPSEAAALFRVDPKTVGRWARRGWLTSIRTMGGHRRYRESDIRAALEDGP